MISPSFNIKVVVFCSFSLFVVFVPLSLSVVLLSPFPFCCSSCSPKTVPVFISSSFQFFSGLNVSPCAIFSAVKTWYCISYMFPSSFVASVFTVTIYFPLLQYSSVYVTSPSNFFVAISMSSAFPTFPDLSSVSTFM